MGILEIHFHDSRFEWNFSPETGKERSMSFGLGSESEGATDDGGLLSRGQSESSGRSASDRSRPAIAPKLKSMAVMALVVGGAVAFSRMRSRRAQQRRETEAESSGRRLSLGRSK